MSESKAGTSSMDTGGAAVLKQSEESAESQSIPSTAEGAKDEGTKNASLSPTKSTTKTNKSPVKNADKEQISGAKLNGEETVKSPLKEGKVRELGEKNADAAKSVSDTNESENSDTPSAKNLAVNKDGDETKSKENESTDAAMTSPEVETDGDKAKPVESVRTEEDMEVTPDTAEEGAEKETPKRRKRSSTAEATPPKTPTTPRSKRTRTPDSAAPASEGRAKRQRRQVEMFQAPTPDSAPPTSPTSVKIYDKNQTLAVRADGATFYLCRCINPVFNTHKRFKIRWFEIEKTPDLYRLAYEDRVELECVIGPAHLQRAKGGLLRLTQPELARIEQLIQAAENGEDVTKLDPALFKPQTANVKASAKESASEKAESDQTENKDDDTDVEPEAEDEPTPKRRRRGAASEATPKTPKEKPVRKARTPKSETPKTPKAPKTPKTPKAKKAPAARSKRSMNKVVSIEKAAPPLRKTATLQLGSLQRKMSLLRRPSSLLRQSSLQRWPSLKVKPKRVKLAPGAPKPPRPPVDPNKKLKHNPRVTVWEKDPLFESRLEVPFVSSMMHSRLAIRAVILKDKDLLQSICDDTKQVAQVNIQRSCHSDRTTMSYAVLSEDKEIIRLLNDETKRYRSRAQFPHNRMTTMGTGTYNPRTLPGVKAVRKLKVSRGAREGNNALTKDRSRNYNPNMSETLQTALEQNVSYETLKYMMDFKMITTQEVFNNIVHAVRFGHCKLASKLMEDAAKGEVHGFNFMHRESLKFDNGEDFTGKLLEASVVKNCVENRNLRPIHCAAINPDTKYLSKMLSICHSWNVEDSDKRRPIHYAAACEGSGPLKLLIEKHVSLYEADETGYTPLIIACITGRAENVRVILDKLIEEEGDNVIEDAHGKKKPSKFGPGGVNKPMKNTWCPIHYAVANRRKDVIQVLVEKGADINKNTGANFNRITPLIMASQDGDLDLVKFLIQKLAKIEKPDKLKRTALIHAVREGNANVASYLLNRGADPNTTDSSGNTALHYAAAYGWYFCMKTLLDAGANPDPPNDWKLTPLGASFLKGNTGLTKILMDIPGVNIDFQDDEGKTLLHHTLDQTPYTKKTVDDVKLLVVQKKANVLLVDKAKKNAIHYLFSHSLPSEHNWRYHRGSDDNREWREAREEAVDSTREILDLLLDKGCDPWPKEHHNIFYMTFNHSKGDRPLEALYRVLEKRPWMESSEASSRTLLHFLTGSLDDEEMLDMLHYLAKQEIDGKKGIEEFKKMAKEKKTSDGRTALIEICHAYASTHYSSWNENLQSFKDKMAKYQKVIKYLIEDLGSEVEYIWETGDDNNKKKWHMTILRPLLATVVEEGFTAFDMALAYKANVDFKFSDGKTLLLERVTAGDYREVKKLLASGAYINQRLEDETKAMMTPLLLCLWHNQVALLPHLLTKGADRSAIKEDTKESALHMAVSRCSDPLEVLTQLITKDSNINVQDKNLRTPLHLVVNRSTDSADESKKLEHLVLKNGADPFIKDIRGRMPIHYLFVKIGQHTRSRMVDPVESYSILNIAMKKQKLDEPDEFGQTPLHRAAFRGATVCAMLLIQGGSNVNAKDKDGNTPLSFAVWHGHDSCALMMIQKGADINGDVINDPTADIHPDILAKRKKEQEKASSTKPNGPVSNNIKKQKGVLNSSIFTTSESEESESYDSDSDSDVDYVPHKNKHRTIHQVIRENISDIKLKPVYKYAAHHYPRPWKPGKRGYPIFQGLVMNGWQGLTFLAMDLLEPFGMQYASVVEIAITLSKFRFAMNLMEKQLDNEKLRVTNPHGQTLIHIMAMTPSSSNESLQEAIVEDLASERKVDMNAQDKDGFTALHHCILKKNWDRAHQLIDGYDLKLDLEDKYGRNALATLMWFGDGNNSSKSLLTKLLKKGSKLDVLVDFPPMSVLDQGYQPQVDVTEYHRAYTNKTISPLICAVIRRSHENVQELLRAGASPNFADSEGMTPLMYAVQTGDDLLVLLLLDRHVNIHTFRKDREELQRQIWHCEVPAPVRTDDNLFAGISTTKKKNQIDVNAVDHQGRTAIHHLLTTLGYGTYEDVTILKMLADSSASMEIKDKSGKSPLDLALERGALTMAKGIQSLLGIPNEEWRLPSFEPFTVADGLTWDGPEVDYVADAQAMLKVMEEEEAKRLAQMPRAVADSRLQIDNAEVVMDEEIDMPYDILMTRVDVKLGEYGLYNFYKMQVVCDTTKDLYLLFNCWGRIGDRGQYQRTPFKSAKEATDEFAKIFKAKSGNEWKDIKSFEAKPKRYRLVDADHRRGNTQVEVKYDLKTDLPSKLPRYIQDLIADLSNVSMLRSTMNSTGINIPFGRLKRDNLLEARKMLTELHDLAQKQQEYESNLTTENIEEYRAVCEQVYELSTEYYYLIPVSGYAYEALEPLKHVHHVEQKIDALTRLLELEFTGTMLLGAQHRIKEMNPYDYIYRAMKVHIQQLSEESTEAQTLLRYVCGDNAGHEIEAIYRIERNGEPERLKACGVDDNHVLLWHGSRVSNLVSILSRGLMITPKDVPITGMAFGRGIYTADYFGKSTSYCFNESGGRNRYMLIGEVALGKMHEVESNRSLPEVLPPKGTNSLKANGRQVPDPRYTTILPTGTKVPLGPLVNNTAPYKEEDRVSYYNRFSRGMNYNEYIVYSEDQICLRYIVQFR